MWEDIISILSMEKGKHIEYAAGYERMFLRSKKRGKWIKIKDCLSALCNHMTTSPVQDHHEFDLKDQNCTIKCLGWDFSIHLTRDSGLKN